MARRLIIGVAVALLAACSDEAELVLDDDAIAAAVEDAFDFGADIVDVACPEIAALDPEVGGETRCIVTAPEESELVLEVDLIVDAAIDGEIVVAAEVVTPLFDVDAAREAIAARLDADLGGDPLVVCGGGAQVVLEPGREISCDVVAEGGTAGPVERSLTIVILDADGNYEVDFTR